MGMLVNFKGLIKKLEIWNPKLPVRARLKQIQSTNDQNLKQLVDEPEQAQKMFWEFDI